MITEREPKQPKLPMSLLSFVAHRRVLNAANVGHAQAALKDCVGEKVDMLNYGVGRGSAKPVRHVEVLSRQAADTMIRGITDAPFRQTVLRGLAVTRLEREVGLLRGQEVTVSAHKFSAKPAEGNLGGFTVSLTMTSDTEIVHDRSDIFHSLAKVRALPCDIPPNGVELPIGVTTDEAVAHEIDGLLYTSGANIHLGPLQFSR